MVSVVEKEALMRQGGMERCLLSIMLSPRGPPGSESAWHPGGPHPLAHGNCGSWIPFLRTGDTE